VADEWVFVVHARPRPWAVYARWLGPPSVGFKSMKQWQEEIQIQVKQDWSRGPLSGALRIDTEFYRPLGKQAPKTKPKQLIYEVTHLIKRPDLDNYRKACIDALQGIVFFDDAQVCEGFMSKRYAPLHSEGYTIIRVSILEL